MRIKKVRPSQSTMIRIINHEMNTGPAIQGGKRSWVAKHQPSGRAGLRRWHMKKQEEKKVAYSG